MDRYRAAVIVATALASLMVTAPAFAHPEDELCLEGEDGLDPALCEALSALDDPNATASELKPILDETGIERGAWSTAGLYVEIGIRHILPGGLDHILFVLALFLSSTRLRALIIQVSTFTVAHTVTLGLAAAGHIAPAPGFVEPLIAATIAFVAIENLFLDDMPKWRPLLVFVFGLVHGLGFAGFFGELGLPPGQFWSALIGFNVGVELGQIGVLALAAAVSIILRRRMAAQGNEQNWRRYVVIPASAMIGVTGLAWTVARLV